MSTINLKEIIANNLINSYNNKDYSTFENCFRLVFSISSLYQERILSSNAKNQEIVCLELDLDMNFLSYLYGGVLYNSDYFSLDILNKYLNISDKDIQEYKNSTLNNLKVYGFSKEMIDYILSNDLLSLFEIEKSVLLKNRLSLGGHELISKILLNELDNYDIVLNSDVKNIEFYLYSFLGSLRQSLLIDIKDLIKEGIINDYYSLNRLECPYVIEDDYIVSEHININNLINYYFSCLSSDFSLYLMYKYNIENNILEISSFNLDNLDLFLSFKG